MNSKKTFKEFIMEKFNVINFHLTNACNYGCIHCFGKFPERQEINFKEACAAVDNIYRYFSKNDVADGRINLAGGEPLLCPYLDGLIDYINAYGLKVSLITNGSLLSEEKIASWKGKIYCIGLSFDSALSETNTAIGRCCNGRTLSVKQAVRITQAIHRSGIKLKINTVVSKLNVNEDMTVFLKRLKPDRLKFLQMEIVEGVNDCASKYKISEKEFDRFCKKHENCCRNTVCERAADLENSYLMINPQGEVQLNNSGRYQTYGSCLERELYEILSRIPINGDRFNSRYGVEKKSEIITEKICIFGGHDTWRKVVKKRLINARFFSDGDLHSLDVVRNADEIWFQSNAISHSFYNKVLDTARLYGIPVSYFTFAGTGKSLEQIILKKWL